MGSTTIIGLRNEDFGYLLFCEFIEWVLGFYCIIFGFRIKSYLLFKILELHNEHLI